jgi:cyclopropane fatty-acyl-phospholipid synthase-like methyltransferase
VFQSERFFREAWPAISQALSTPEAAARAVRWILAVTGVKPGARVLDSPCGFGRHSVALARQGFRVTGVDFSDTELDRARVAARQAGVELDLLSADMRDTDFSSEFELAVNLDQSIGYFSDDEDRQLIDRFWRALVPEGCSCSTLGTATSASSRCRPRSAGSSTTGRSASTTPSTR